LQYRGSIQEKESLKVNFSTFFQNIHLKGLKLPKGDFHERG